MIIENKNDYIYYRFHRAQEALDDALILAEKGKWNECVTNRGK